MDGACGTRVGQERCIQGNLREKDHFEDQGIDGRKLALQTRMGGGGMDWIDLAQDRDKWWALLGMVLSLMVP
jgi:hypothetical protein